MDIIPEKHLRLGNLEKFAQSLGQSQMDTRIGRDQSLCLYMHAMWDLHRIICCDNPSLLSNPFPAIKTTIPVAIEGGTPEPAEAVARVFIRRLLFARQDRGDAAPAMPCLREITLLDLTLIEATRYKESMMPERLAPCGAMFQLGAHVLHGVSLFTAWRW